jgi:hypothetical protein
MRIGNRVAERFPAEHWVGLFVHRQVGFVVGVEEDMGVALVVAQASFEELELSLLG